MKQTRSRHTQFVIMLKVLTALAFYFLQNISNVVASEDLSSQINESHANNKNHDLSRLFLRDSEVLLNPKEIQFSIGFDYSTNEYQSSYRKKRNRSISMPLSISYGLTRRLELNSSLPFVYNKTELISDTSVQDESNSDIGDMSFGFSYRLKSETISSPSITASMNVIAPTGAAYNPNELNGLSTGSGFWGISTSFSFSKSIDPSVVFFSLGYQHTFEDDHFGSKVQPGGILTYGFGTGFSVNSLIALSCRISGSYQKEVKIDNSIVPGTSYETISLIWSMSYMLNNLTRLEAMLSQGISDEADDVGIGFSLIWSF